MASTRSSGVPTTAAPAPVGAAAGDLFEQLPRVVDVLGAGTPEHVHVVLVVPALQAVHGLRAGLLAVSARCNAISTRQSRRSTV